MATRATLDLLNRPSPVQDIAPGCAGGVIPPAQPIALPPHECPAHIPQVVVRLFGGKQEVVTLRRLTSPEDVQTFGVLLADLEQLAEFLAGREPGWARGVMGHSLAEIIVTVAKAESATLAPYFALLDTFITQFVSENKIRRKES